MLIIYCYVKTIDLGLVVLNDLVEQKLEQTNPHRKRRDALVESFRLR